MNRERVLGVDLNQETDAVLEHAFRGTEFVLDRCGSAKAAVHKLQGETSPLLVLLENRRPVKAEDYMELLAAVRGAQLPIVLLDDGHIAAKHAQILRYHLQLLTPPLYPYRLYRQIRTFRWRDKNVYVVRNPGRKAKMFAVVFYNPQGDASDDVVEHWRGLFTEQGNRFFYTDKEAVARDLCDSHARTLLLLATGNRGLETLGVLPPATGWVVCAAPTAMTTAAVAADLHRGAYAVLPALCSDDDFSELYASLRFLRG